MNNVAPKKVTCIFVHGWAMNSAVWQSTLDALPDWVDAVSIDLPGHGTMHDVTLGGLDRIADMLAALATRPAVWVGWSMGGLAVLRLAELFPERVRSALLVATNPCFVCRPGWVDGIDINIFRQFSADLEADQEKTIRRFLALQVKGQDDAVRVVRKLHQAMQQRGGASQQALMAGLDILLDTNLTGELAQIRPPLHWALGARDTLVPVSLAATLKTDYQQSHVTVYDKTAHAPFLTEPGQFMNQLMSVLEQSA